MNFDLLLVVSCFKELNKYPFVVFTTKNTRCCDVCCCGSVVSVRDIAVTVTN